MRALSSNRKSAAMPQAPEILLDLPDLAATEALAARLAALLRPGDAVLLQVSRLLKEIVRKPDLVLRWGGEEFLVLALDSDRISPPLIAVRIHEQMGRHSFTLPGGQSIRQTCSVGYAIFPFHPDRPEGLGWEQVFRLADESLYGAKEKGRNRLQGILPGPADPDAIVAALQAPDPDFPKAVAAGFIEIG